MAPKLFGGSDATAANQVDIEAKIDIIDTNVDTLILRATADAGSNATTIVCAELAGFGEDYFNTGWQACILQNVDAVGTAPEGEWRDITNYVSATGTFTVTAYSAPVGTGDYVMIARDEFVNPNQRLKHYNNWIDETAGLDQWYTVIDLTTPGELYKAGMAMQTLAEDLEMRVTVDTEVYTGPQAAAVASSNYQPYLFIIDNTGAGYITFSTSTTLAPIDLPFHALKIEVRKTSNNGANQLNGWVMYSIYELP